MSQTQTTAPLGRCAKSLGAAQTPTPISRREVAEYVRALRHHAHHDHAVCRAYIEALADAIDALDCSLSATSVVTTLHEMQAYARLLRRTDEDGLGPIQLSVRSRITHPTQAERVEVGLWRALWASLCTYPTCIEMALLADTMDAAVHAVRMITLRSRSDQRRDIGGLTAQRWAWADADR